MGGCQFSIKALHVRRKKIGKDIIVNAYFVYQICVVDFSPQNKINATYLCYHKNSLNQHFQSKIETNR